MTLDYTSPHHSKVDIGSSIHRFKISGPFQEVNYTFVRFKKLIVAVASLQYHSRKKAQDE
jgi:hypothetical protein